MKTIFLFFLILLGFKGFAGLISASEVSDTNYQQYYDATKALPNGYVKDGSKDYTKYIQNAINNYKNILMPDFVISTTGLLAVSDSHIKFQSNSKLKLIPTNRERYQVLALHGVENVIVTDANIEGDLKNHKGTKGEWGFGIDIRNSRNITIKDAKVNNCWGDGIIVAYGTKGFLGRNTFETANVTISGFNISNCRRNGITVGGVNNLILNNGVISKIKGTAPETGIMIEPDYTQYVLRHISITNVSIDNCSTGISTNLRKYISQKVNKKFELTISDVSLKNNRVGIYFAAFKNVEKLKSLNGNIKIQNIKTVNNVRSFVNNDKNSLFPAIKLDDFTIDGKKKNITNFSKF